MSHHGLGEQRGSHCTFAPLHGGDAYIHKGHGHIYMYIQITFTYIYTHIYVLCIKHTHLHVRQSEEMIPAVVGPPRSEVS